MLTRINLLPAFRDIIQRKMENLNLATTQKDEDELAEELVIEALHQAEEWDSSDVCW